jgi:hypothetical protein
MKTPTPSVTRQNLLCAAALGLIPLSAPFPQVQTVLHAMLVLALAPRPGAPLAGALWALAGGWTLEGSLRLMPHLGGTPWADLTLVLLVGWMAGRWPPEGLRGWLARLAAFSAVHALVLHGAVRLATVSHPWGWGWFWTLLSVPLWGGLSWWMLRAGAGTGRR